MTSTDAEYARRLQRLSNRRWKKLIPNPYGWKVRRIATGRVVDVGCGIGRCLDFVRPRGVGVDPNAAAIAVCREKGHTAYRPEEFGVVYGSREPDRRFDSLLCAHVLEHLDEATGVDLIRSYLPHLRPDGRVVLITPQERGQASDATHVRFMDDDALMELADRCGLVVETMSSFPLPRRWGKWFVYNETITTARVATATSS
ncbi:MAG TPA: class I SAM-dependent methyltransferase [Ilumatobacteraceae bacterium]